MNTLCATGLYITGKIKIRRHSITYKMQNKTVFGWIMILVAYSSALSDGSSDQSCMNSIMPGHNITTQISAAPFYILIDDGENKSREKTSNANQTSSVNGKMSSNKLKFL